MARLQQHSSGIRKRPKDPLYGVSTVLKRLQKKAGDENEKKGLRRSGANRPGVSSADFSIPQEIYAESNRPDGKRNRGGYSYEG